MKRKRLYTRGKCMGLFMSSITVKKVFIIFLIVLFLYCLGAIFQQTCFGRFVADMVYDGAFKEYLYEGQNCAKNNGFASVLATLLGELLLSGLILATIIGYFRSAGERYLNGQYRKYHWRNHTLFLGYDEKMLGILKKSCDKNGVVIAVPNKVKELRDVLKSILSDKELEGVEFVQCRRDDADDLLMKACVLEANQIYIIGQSDEQNHDALNFKCLAEIINLCKLNKKQHVIMYLQNQYSFSILKTKTLEYDELKTLIPSYNKNDIAAEKQLIMRMEQDIRMEIEKKIKAEKPDEKELADKVDKRFKTVINNIDIDKYISTNRHIKIVNKYLKKRKDVNILVESVKDNNELIAYWIAARKIDWPQAAYALCDEIEKRKLITKEEIVAYYNKYNCGQSFINSNCEFFNFYSDTAFRMLTDENGMKLDWHSDDKNLVRCPERQVHLVVVGMTEMGVAIVREALKLAHPTGKNTRFKITMVDENAYEEMHYFIGRTKELFDYCHYTYQDYDKPGKDFSYKPENDFLDVEFEFVKCDAAHPKLMKNLVEWATDGKQLLSLVVCTKKSSQNMAVALYLPRQLRVGEYAIPVWVYQEGDDSMKHLMDGDNYKDIHPFSVNDHAVFTILGEEPKTDIFEGVKKLAMKYEQAYSGQEQNWEKMSAIKRWSSIYTGFSMTIKLRSVGYELTEKNQEIIDRIEHNRWNVEKLSDGFIPTTKEQHDEVEEVLKGIINKNTGWQKKTNEELDSMFDKYEKKLKEYKDKNIHDNIRSYDDLDEYSKHKDRFILEKFIELAKDQ